MISRPRDYTEDALETAADSYGGLTDRCMP